MSRWPHVRVEMIGIKTRLCAIAAGATLCVALLLAAEGMLRLWGPRENYARYDPQTRWSLRPGYRGPGPNLPDSELSYELSVNDAGLRGGPVARSKPPDSVRLAAIGDSVTFGFGVREEETYHARAVAMLAADFAPRRIEGVNAGVPGFSSLQGLRLLRSHVLPLAPDIVTVLYGWNDGWRASASDAAWNGDSVEATIQSSRLLTLTRSGVSSVVRRFGPGVRPEPRAMLPRVSPHDFEVNLLDIAEAVRRAGAIPIFITAPAAFGPDRPPDAYFRYGWTVPREELEPTRLRYAEAARRAARAARAPLVDCARLIPPDPGLFLADGYHPNETGHRAMADQIVEALREAGVTRGVGTAWSH